MTLTNAQPPHPRAYQPGDLVDSSNEAALVDAIGSMEGRARRVYSLWPTRGGQYDNALCQFGIQIRGGDWQNLAILSLDEEDGVDLLECIINLTGVASTGFGALVPIRFRLGVYSDAAAAYDEVISDYYDMITNDTEQAAVLRISPNVIEGRPGSSARQQIDQISLREGETPDLSLVAAWPCVVRLQAAMLDASSLAYVSATYIAGRRV